VTTATDTVLDREGARRLATRSFAGRDVGNRLGLELEWHVYDPSDHTRRLTPDEVTGIVGAGGPLAPGVTTSVEPGGQVELNTPPLPTTDACRLATTAAAELRARLVTAGLEPVAVGTDPHRTPENLLDVPRYRAMAATFTARGGHGVQMMANTAAFQVNVDLGTDGERWRLVHEVGPVLVAAFANSPVGPGGARGWQSHRLANWWAVDPSRTRPVPHLRDPAEAWLRYALDANVLLIRRGDEAVPVLEPFPFERWMRDGHPLGPPTVDDFAYHLTTLFPPVRPRGYLELRFLDALELPHWLVAAGLVTGFLHDSVRRDVAAVVEPAAGRWIDAARLGLADEALARIADDVTELALTGLDRSGAGAEVLGAVRRWRDTELRARRSPASAVASRWERTGTVIPTPGVGDS
jgi:glutamate--cysteine ligase